MTLLGESAAALFRALFETAPDATIVVDRDGRIVLANAQADRLFGYEGDGLRGNLVEMLLPHAVRAGHGAHRARFMANPRLRPMGGGFELVGMRRDGSEFPVEISLSPVRAGDTALFAASIRDISETQRARQALTRARYDTLVGQAGRLALESRDNETLLQNVAEIVASALSVDAVTVLITSAQQRDFRVGASLDTPPQLLEQLSLLFNAESSPLQDMSGPCTLAELEHGTGEHLRKLVLESGFGDAAVLALSDRYEPMGVLLVFAPEARAFDRDKLHFLQSVANLLSSALQRSRSEEQLAHAQRLDAIGQLTGGVAHDFNNLLTVISGNLQLLETESAGEREQIIQSALRAVRNGAALTRKLLAFARRQRLTPRTIDPHSWLQELSALLKRTLGESVTVSIDCPPGLPNVYADPGELDAALVNLALNARDAMPRGGELSIGVYDVNVALDGEVADLKAGRYVRILVSDTGLGMPPDALARALEPFFTTKVAGKGSGLGLSMVYGFVRQSGGNLTIDSQLGYGTRVALYLPSANAPTTPTSTREYSAARGDEVVLVVEDEPEVRDIAVAFLKSLGYASLVAANADEALGILRTHPKIDLLFSDVVLGSGMSGVELAHQALRENPQLAVLLTSGYEHAMLDDDAPFPLLRKPYSREDFADAVGRWTARDVGPAGARVQWKPSAP